MELIQHSKSLSNIVDEDRKTEEINDEYISRLLSTLQFPVNNIIKMESGYYDFDDKQLVTLINNLNCIDHIYLNDLILYSKYRRSKFIEQNLDFDCKIIYDSFDTKLPIFISFVKVGNISICKYLYENVDKRINSKSSLAFRIACEYGQIEIAKWLHSLNRCNICAKKCNAFELACEGDHLDLVMWLYPLIKNKVKRHLAKIFNSCCYLGAIKVIKYFYDLIPVIGYRNNYNDSRHLFSHGIQKCFEISLSEGELELAKWFYQLNPELLYNLRFEVLFKTALRDKSLNCARFIYSLGIINPSFAFVSSICYNHLEFAKEIYSSNNSVIDIDNNILFETACCKGNLEIAKYLYSIDTKLELPDFDTLKKLVQNHRLNILKWLHSLDENYLLQHVKKLMEEACERRKLEILQWLYSQYEIDINYDNDFLFDIALRKIDFDIANWIFQLNGFDKLNPNDPVLKDEKSREYIMNHKMKKIIKQYRV